MKQDEYLDEISKMTARLFDLKEKHTKLKFDTELVLRKNRFLVIKNQGLELKLKRLMQVKKGK